MLTLLAYKCSLPVSKHNILEDENDYHFVIYLVITNIALEFCINLFKPNLNHLLRQGKPNLTDTIETTRLDPRMIQI